MSLVKVNPRRKRSVYRANQTRQSLMLAVNMNQYDCYAYAPGGDLGISNMTAS